jgi:tetratricopeptide (TPR) repeat protein
MAPETDRARARRTGAKFALLIGSVIVALLLGEAVVRLAGLAPEVIPIWTSSERTVYQRSTNPILSFELKADYRDDSPDFRRSYERTNSHGLRDVEREIDKPHGTRRVILLGDSVVEGHGVPEDDTIARQLEALYPDGKTQVLNMGVTGYCTLAEVELLEVKGLAFEPDVVVLFFVENDFLNFNREAFPLGAPRDRPALVKHLFVRSHLFRSVAIRTNLYGFGSEADPVTWNQQAIGESNVVEGLTRLSALARRHGFSPLIVIWPRFGDHGIEEVHPMADGSGDLVIERLARMHGMPTFRLSSGFAEDLAAAGPGANPRLRYTIGDGQHPSREGARVTAGAIQSMLASFPTVRDDHRETSVASERATDLPALETALALGRPLPNYSRVYNNIGAELLSSDRPDEALRYFERALAEDGDNASAHYNRGKVLEARGELSEAAAEFEAAARLRLDNAEALNALGRVLALQGDLDRALGRFEQALRVKPDYYKARLNLGVILEKQGALDDAIEQFREAVRIDPGQADAHYRLGRALDMRDDPAGAEEHLVEAVRLDPSHARAHNHLGTVLARQGRVADAARHFELVLSIDPGHEKARRNLDRARRVLSETRPD